MKFRRLLFTLVLMSSFPALAFPDAALDRARGLLLHGRYDEARRAYEPLAASQPAAAAIGIAACFEAVGANDEALRTLAALVARHPGAAGAHAELARLEFERGRYEAAQARVDSALAHDADEPEARYYVAELHRVAGRLEQADEAYRWFIRWYNARQDSLPGPESYRWIGLGAAQVARWNRNSSQFHFLVNTLYPDGLKSDSTYWPIHLEAARLFIEKYNRPDAQSELAAALAINPNAAELHAARAMIALQQFDLDSARAAIDRALALNPRLVLAHQLRADVAMLAVGPRAATPFLEQARALDPADEETLGRLAAVYGAIDGLRDSAGTRMGPVMAEAERRNPHCGAFFASVGAALELMQRFPDAARAYEEARRRMPQLVGVPGQLGMVALRLGEETRARDILTEAFAADPFNVRVKNSLDVLDLLRDYGTLTTPHFVVRFDRGRDSLLAGYASRWLEQEVYPEIVRTFGYAPKEPALFEIFSRHEGTSGHGWFSARLVGLPFVGIVGGCPGKMVALTSPSDGQSFDWARVLKHEFVHIVNLQQTDFTIPRWFTEGLAVLNEGPGRPHLWDQALVRRTAVDSLFDLDTIQMGFMRPATFEDWTLAYYQAELYARYMNEQYGADAQRRLIAAYAEHLDTRGALKRAFGVNQEAFEQGYRAYVKRIADATGHRERPPTREDANVLERAAAASPGDAHLLARLAQSRLESGRTIEADEAASRALALDPHEPTAALIKARVLLAANDVARATATLSAAFDPAVLQFDALLLFTNLMLNAKNYPEVDRLATLGSEHFPLDANWDAALTLACRETGQKARLAEVLARRAAGESDDLAVHLELAQLADERSDFEAAARWATDVIHIDVASAEGHAILARALAQRGKHDAAIDEYEVATSLDPSQVGWRVAEARACVAAGRKSRARELLSDVLRRDPHAAGARELLDTLGR